MSKFFAGEISQLETGWYDATITSVSEPRVSAAGNEWVNVQFELDVDPTPVFQGATLPFYDRIVRAAGQKSRDPNAIVGQPVALRIEVDEWANMDVKVVQHIGAPRTTEQFRAARAARPTVPVAARVADEMSEFS